MSQTTRFCLSLFLLGLAALTACDDGASSPRFDAETTPSDTPLDTPAPDDSDAAGPDADSDADEADATPPIDLYDPGHVLQIDLIVAEQSWDELRRQTRNSVDVFAGEDCLSQPFDSPFSWFRADTVSVDGETFNDVGVRKKGFLGSLDEERPSLKLKFDRYVDNQTIGGREGLTLNNAIQDPALVRQCLGYAFYAAAGLPAPACSFAHVTVNGRSLGVYVNVEPINHRFLASHFDNPDGALYEGTLSDFTPAWRGTFELKSSGDGNGATIDELVAALQLPDPELIAALEPLVDLDAFTRHWAVESLLAAFDAYSSNSNNFFIYDDPTTELSYFIPWGLDEIFPPEIPEPDELPVKFTDGLLARRLYRLPSMRERYHEQLRELLDTLWVADELELEVDRMIALFSPHLAPAQRESLDAAAAWLREVIRGREAVVLRELETVLEVELDPRPTYCIEAIGTVSGRFATVWGSLEDDPFEVGSGSFEALIAGEDWSGEAVGVHAGYQEEDGEAVLTLFVAQADGSLVVVPLFLGHNTAIAPGVLPVELGFVQHLSDTDETLLGLLGEVELSIEEGSSNPGAPLLGSFSATVLDL